jgi:hypothetical protein
MAQQITISTIASMHSRRRGIYSVNTLADQKRRFERPAQPKRRPNVKLASTIDANVTLAQFPKGRVAALQACAW